MCHKENGVRNSVQKPWTPWDSIRRNVRLKQSGDRVTRCSLLIRPGFWLGTSYLGLGLINAKDVGRTLIVDFYPDGRTIGYLETPKVTTC
jgi:hypothetical protein